MVVIVSAFYPIPSKQPYGFYRPHLERWFRSLRVAVVFFTTPEIWKDIQTFGVPLWHVQPIFHPFVIDSTLWNRQHARDPEPYHTPELGALWRAKREFVLRAATLHPTEVLIWCDAGCIRDDVSEAAARSFGQRLPAWLTDGTLHLQWIRDQPIQPFYRYPEYRIACAIMAGTREAWVQADMDYATVLQEYDEAAVSAISDQYVTASCQDRWPTHYTAHPIPSTAVDPWFFFLDVL